MSTDTKNPHADRFAAVIAAKAEAAAYRAAHSPLNPRTTPAELHELRRLEHAAIEAGRVARVA
ncbi:MAG TPA: hypothetical protein VGJ32_09125 [Solirubrobacteraceae bacterium]